MGSRDPDEKALVESAQRDPRRFGDLYARAVAAGATTLHPLTDQP